MKEYDQAELMSPKLNISNVGVSVLLNFYLRMEVRVTVQVIMMTPENETVLFTIVSPTRYDWIKYFVPIPEGEYRIVFRTALGRTTNPRVSLSGISISRDSHPSSIPVSSWYSPNYGKNVAHDSYRGNPFQKMRDNLISGGGENTDSDYIEAVFWSGKSKKCLATRKQLKHEKM